MAGETGTGLSGSGGPSDPHPAANPAISPANSNPLGFPMTGVYSLEHGVSRSLDSRRCARYSASMKTGILIVGMFLVSTAALAEVPAVHKVVITSAQGCGAPPPPGHTPNCPTLTRIAFQA